MTDEMNWISTATQLPAPCAVRNFYDEPFLMGLDDISVSEAVLVTLKINGMTMHMVSVGCLIDGEWIVHVNEAVAHAGYKVIAWMPLPAACTEELK